LAGRGRKVISINMNIMDRKRGRGQGHIHDPLGTPHISGIGDVSM